MKWPAFASLSCALAVHFVSCFQKKSIPAGAPAWLEAHFPGQFEVMETNRDLSLINMAIGKYKSIVRERADTMVQFAFFWSKNATEYGLSKAEIQKLADTSRNEMRIARELTRFLKQSGIDKSSIGVKGQDVVFARFAEPMPAEREHTLQQLLKALESWEQKDNFRYWLDFMEDSAYREVYGDIIPDGHWHRQDNWQRKHKILSLKFNASQMQDYPTLSKKWISNTESKRFDEYAETAHSQALDWAESHFNKPFYLESRNMMEFQLDKIDGLSIWFWFPHFDEKPEQEELLKGHVTGMYQIDNGMFQQIDYVPIDSISQ